MRNRFIFLIAVIILLVTIWVATIAGISLNRKAGEGEKENISIHSIVNSKNK